MAASKLKRPLVIDQLYEQKEILARILGIPRMEPIVYESTNLTRTKILDLVGKHLASNDWDSEEKAELIESLQDTKTTELEQIRQRFARWIHKITSHNKYMSAQEGYLNQDHPQVGPSHKTSLHKFLTQYAYNELEIGPNETLFHGVEVNPTADFEIPNGSNHTNHKAKNGHGRPSLMPAAQYADILGSISTKGLKASPAMENLPKLESIFAVSEANLTYGLAGVCFNLGEREKAWGQTCNPIEGIQIVKPVIKEKLTIFLKSPDFLDYLDEEVCGAQSILATLDIDRFMNYQIRLEEELSKRGIPYVIIDPEGVEV